MSVLRVVALLALAAPRGSPTVDRVLPRGGQRGTEVAVTLSGERLADAAELLFSEKGLEVVSLEAPDEKRVVAKLKIAPDAALGEHRLRLRTRTGISELRTFWVGPFPTVDEKEPNDDQEHAQPVARNVTIEGTVTNEDVDVFALDMKAGERLTAEVEGLRLGDALFDPFVAILDAKRFELASCDDCALTKQDPLASCVVPADGRYFVLIRESSYRGSDRCRYRLHVGTFPRPLVAFPPGGKPGVESELQLLGDVKGTFTQKWKPEPGGPSETWLVPEQDGVSAPSGVAVKAINADATAESEPNDDFARATDATRAAPLVVDGAIGRPGDFDCIKFAGKANQPLNVRVNARSVRSPLDPVLTIHAADGKQLEASDDTIGLDSYIRFTPPADGDYFARITDHLGAGGPLYVWRFVITPVAPSLALDVPRFGRDSQARQTVAVPRGGRVALVVHASRGNFGGDVALSADGLPDGVQFNSAPMGKSVDTTLALFEATADAPLAGRLVDVVGDCVEPKTKGHLRQRFDLVVLQPNDVDIYDTSTDRVAVAVTEEVPFALAVDVPKIPLVQGGSQPLRVHATRKPGFDAPIVVRMLWLPPGLGAQPTLTLEKGQGDLLYPVNAAGDAPLTTWQLALQGEADSGRGLVFASSALTPLTVAAPFLQLKLDLAATEQGKPVQVVAHLEPATPFEGKATVRLHGLPPKCSAPDREIVATDTSVIFDVTTAPDTPAGKHTSLFCEVDVVKDGEAIVHYLGGGGTLRVDPPAKPKPEAAPATAAPAAAAEKPAEKKKPLSRLEQLRQEAQPKTEPVKPASEKPATDKPGGGGRGGDGNDGDRDASKKPTAPPLEDKKAIASLAIYPPSIRLRGAADRQGFVVQATYADGTTADVTKSVRASVVDATVARIADGFVLPGKDGATELKVELPERTASAAIEVAAAAEVKPVSFRLDVMPLFARHGCNQGSCHGSARGQDGFRLSLFGFDPEGDHFRITRELATRRVNLAQPEQSLLLQKALGNVTHTGGKRFESDSESAATLRRWLVAGTPNDAPDVAKPAALELFPPGAVLEGTGAKQSLTVRAIYSDGSDRDVTSLALFFSSNDASAAVDPAGHVTAGQRGEAFVMARFATFTVGVPFVVIPSGLDYVRPVLKEDDAIDRCIDAKLERLRIVPSGLCTDEEFLRRASLDVVGVAPTREEFERFMADAAPDKRARRVDELLGRKEFAELWVMKWAELLQMRTDDNNRVPYKATLLYFHWLEDQIARNVPFDSTVRDLLSASGGTFRNPPANYYQVERETLKLAENTAQVFLGMRVQCAQCHNHPFDRWTMDDYYGFAAFFARVGRKNGEDPRETIVFDAKGGEVTHPVGGRVMAPKFLGGATPDCGTRDRRAVLADWITAPDNPWFAKNLVNIVWAHFFGNGIVQPVDDGRVSNPPANPELQDELARRFVAYHYDFKKLVRDLCLSQAYQRTSRTNPTNELDHRNFSHAEVRRVRAEVLLDVLSQVTGTPNKFPGLPKGARAVQIADGNVSNYFLETFGRASRATVCSCEVKMEPNLSQALHLLNGEDTTARIRDGGVVKGLLGAGKKQDEMPTPEAVIVDLFIRCLTRRPTDAEVAELVAKLPQDPAQLETGLEDVFWALLNSKEFAFNH